MSTNQEGDERTQQIPCAKDRLDAGVDLESGPPEVGGWADVCGVTGRRVVPDRDTTAGQPQPYELNDHLAARVTDVQRPICQRRPDTRQDHGEVIMTWPNVG